jgi:hypothetical protein
VPLRARPGPSPASAPSSSAAKPPARRCRPQIDQLETTLASFQPEQQELLNQRLHTFIAGLEELPKRAGCVKEAVIARRRALCLLPGLVQPRSLLWPPRPGHALAGGPDTLPPPPLLAPLLQVPKQLVEFVDQGGNPDEYFVSVRAWRLLRCGCAAPGEAWRVPLAPPCHVGAPARPAARRMCSRRPAAPCRGLVRGLQRASSPPSPRLAPARPGTKHASRAAAACCLLPPRR